MRTGEVVAVAVGGALGTGLRVALDASLPAGAGGVPTGTVVANLGGAALLGLLVGAVVGADAPAARWVPWLGTGLLGGLTTYSGLVLASLAAAPAVGAAHALGTVGAGLLLAAGGVRVGAAAAGRRGAAAREGATGRDEVAR
ncbi:MAG: CrcB family protein [Actinomycetes bacterium]